MCETKLVAVLPLHNRIVSAEVPPAPSMRTLVYDDAIPLRSLVAAPVGVAAETSVAPGAMNAAATARVATNSPVIRRVEREPCLVKVDLILDRPQQRLLRCHIT